MASPLLLLVPMKLLTLLVSSLSVGCLSASDAEQDAAERAGTSVVTVEQANITDRDTPAARFSAHGAYRLHTTLDLTAEAFVPETVADIIAILRDVATSPGRALFDLAERAGVPAVGTIRDALPSYVEDKLYGWIDGELAAAQPIAAEIVALAESALTTVAIDSTLDVEANTHALAQLDFTPAGIDAQVPLAAFGATSPATCTTAAATLTIGDHRYGIPYGELAWRAIDERMQVRATLGAAFDCTAMANRVAAKCYWGVCVGHAAELAEICERGLDEAVARAQAKFAEQRFDALRFAAGTATVTRDAALANGTWTAEIDAGQGLRHAPATFTATR